MMATAFDGIGMGMLGSEKNYMSSGGGDLRFLLGSLLKKGLGESTSNVPLPPWPQFENKPVEPPTASTTSAPVAPAVQIDTDNHPDTENVMKDLGFQSKSSSFVSPDVLTARNPAQDQIPMQMASAPPPKLDLPKYGQDDGGVNPLSILSTLATLFV
jgi:hypothetical protein